MHPGAAGHIWRAHQHHHQSDSGQCGRMTTLQCGDARVVDSGLVMVTSAHVYAETQWYCERVFDDFSERVARTRQRGPKMGNGSYMHA